MARRWSRESSTDRRGISVLRVCLDLSGRSPPVPAAQGCVPDGVRRGAGDGLFGGQGAQRSSSSVAANQCRALPGRSARTSGSGRRIPWAARVASAVRPLRSLTPTSAETSPAFRTGWAGRRSSRARAVWSARSPATRSRHCARRRVARSTTCSAAAADRVAVSANQRTQGSALPCSNRRSPER